MIGRIPVTRVAQQARKLHTAAPRLDDHGSHPTFVPPFSKPVVITLWTIVLVGGLTAIGSSVAHQQKKGGFWFKEKKTE